MKKGGEIPSGNKREGMVQVIEKKEARQRGGGGQAV